MSVESKKLTLIEQILHTDDESLLDQIRQLLSSQPQEAEWPSVSNLEQRAIAEGLNDIENGRTSSHDEVMHRVKNKFGF